MMLRGKSFKTVLLIGLCLLFGMTACGKEKAPENDFRAGMPQVIHVSIASDPEKITPGQKVSIEATVTQNDEAVNDADKVKFEIWKYGQEEHEMVDGVFKGDGVYAVEKSFPEDGVYYAISHVDARGMHSMPTLTMIVGDVSEEELTKIEQNEPQSSHMDHDHGHGDHDDHEDGQHDEHDHSAGEKDHAQNASH